MLERCIDVPAAAHAALAAEFAAGNRVVALVATRPAGNDRARTAQDEHGMHLERLLVFLDPPKPDAAHALRRLADLAVAVKVVTGDNAAAALKICAELGLGSTAALSGADLDDLAAAIPDTTVFARVSPEHQLGLCACSTTPEGVRRG